VLRETQHLRTVTKHGRAPFGEVEPPPVELGQVCDESRGGFTFALHEPFHLIEQCVIRKSSQWSLHI